MKTKITCSQCGNAINGSFYALKINGKEKMLCQQCTDEKLPITQRLKSLGRSPGPRLVEIHIGVHEGKHQRGEVRFLIPLRLIEENCKNLFNKTEA